MKSDNQHVDTVMAEADKNYINIKLKNMAATLQKELKEFGHWKNNEDKGETPRHMANVTLRSKVRRVCSLLTFVIVEQKSCT
jgi:hypothetical protein